MIPFAVPFGSSRLGSVGWSAGVCLPSAPTTTTANRSVR